MLGALTRVSAPEMRRAHAGVSVSASDSAAIRSAAANATREFLTQWRHAWRDDFTSHEPRDIGGAIGHTEGDEGALCTERSAIERHNELSEPAVRCLTPNSRCNSHALTIAQIESSAPPIRRSVVERLARCNAPPGYRVRPGVAISRWVAARLIESFRASRFSGLRKSPQRLGAPALPLSMAALSGDTSIALVSPALCATAYFVLHTAHTASMRSSRATPLEVCRLMKTHRPRLTTSAAPKPMSARVLTRFARLLTSAPPRHG